MYLFCKYCTITSHSLELHFIILPPPSNNQPNSTKQRYTNQTNNEISSPVEQFFFCVCVTLPFMAWSAQEFFFRRASKEELQDLHGLLQYTTLLLCSFCCLLTIKPIVFLLTGMSPKFKNKVIIITQYTKASYFFW